MNRRRRILPSMFNLLGVIIFIKLFLTSKASPITYSTFSLRALARALDSNNSVPRSCWKIFTRYSQYDDNSWNTDQNFTDNRGCDGKVEKGSLQLKFSLACSTFPSTEQGSSMLRVGCIFNGFNQIFLLRWDDVDIPEQAWVTRCKELVVAPIKKFLNQSDYEGNVTTFSVLQALGLKGSSPFRMCDDCRRSNRYCGYVHNQEWKSACFCDAAAVKTSPPPTGAGHRFPVATPASDPVAPARLPSTPTLAATTAGTVIILY